MKSEHNMKSELQRICEKGKTDFNILRKLSKKGVLSKF